MTKQASFTIEPEPVDSPDAQRALARYVAELDRRFPGGFDTSRAAPPARHDFAPPAGAFLVVRVEEQVLGCGALRTEPGGVGEIRRMWIAPELRGRGAGRALLAALEDQARRLGCDRVRLDTAAELVEARRLYESAGYRQIPAYNNNAYAQFWYEKSLD
ncbi:GCN5 family N-acetyltransferase [Saccharopolyspora subtropica]|uniref:GCN5 family N-acetyltransferase n=1 Tax=Saccharopolyspora thermophila TaxID=89367 RepID=A0A917KB52_9PSEU|nr:GNAT family N-acetyltransferase [Saccharopolyspora subtropica]GGJ04606.1 GCN5 family N-acetyltransferase [Saccharopolyspora subtropica]